MTQPLRCDVDLVQPSARQMITQPDALATGSLTSRSPDRLRQLGIAQDVEGEKKETGALDKFLTK